LEEFPLQVRWEGSTASEFSRDAVASTAGKQDIAVSSAPSYAGNGAHWNPEDLFGASLATCHMLTFLSLAKKVRLDVRGYEDRATVVLDTVDKVTRVTKVRLAPTIRVAPGTDAAKVREMFEKAHKYCFIGQSTSAEVEMAPVIEEAR
jgi:organic hydroperoxide reductase OsmC/OhrA